MPRPINSIYSKLVDIVVEVDFEHHLYRPVGGNTLKPDGYQCRGCKAVFSSDNLRRRHRAEAIVDELLEYLAARRN